MKRILAMLLAFMLVVCGALTAFAEEEDSSSQAVQTDGSTPEGTPPDMPEGGMPGNPGGMPPEKVHCSLLAEDALKKALKNALEKL